MSTLALLLLKGLITKYRPEKWGIALSVDNSPGEN